MKFFADSVLSQLQQPFHGISILLLLVFALFLVIAFRLRDTRNSARQLQEELRRVQHDYVALKDEFIALKVRNAKLVTLLTNERKNSQEKIDLLEEAREKLRLQFQELAQQIFDEKSEKFGQDNKERLSALLQPLQEQLHSFQTRMNAVQADDIRERTSLKEEILHLRELNQQINREATNLTRALKGDKKMQGNWGELVLERVLERSGLRKGEEYTVQSGFRDRDNRLLKPDVIIHLPDGKEIIIDSKVPLSAWERHVSADSEAERARHLKEHLHNLRGHISSLSAKNYEGITSLHSLDFVLLFIPIDSSFTAAYEADEQLFTDAYDKRIIIVTPTTLLATLKTIENVWRYEHRNRNATEIAERAGAIYDKLCSFLEEMEKVGKQLATCSSSYESAMNKLATGRGNVINQAAKLSELGVTTKKTIPRSMEILSDNDVPN